MAPRRIGSATDVVRSREVLPDVEAALEAEVAHRRRLRPEGLPPDAGVDPKPISRRRRAVGRVRSYLDAADMEAAEREANFHEGDDRWSSSSKG
jgi:hypothetical protein